MPELAGWQGRMPFWTMSLIYCLPNRLQGWLHQAQDDRLGLDAPADLARQLLALQHRLEALYQRAG